MDTNAGTCQFQRISKRLDSETQQPFSISLLKKWYNKNSYHMNMWTYHFPLSYIYIGFLAHRFGLWEHHRLWQFTGSRQVSTNLMQFANVHSSHRHWWHCWRWWYPLEQLSCTNLPNNLAHAAIDCLRTVCSDTTKQGPLTQSRYIAPSLRLSHACADVWGVITTIITFLTHGCKFEA